METRETNIRKHFQHTEWNRIRKFYISARSEAGKNVCKRHPVTKILIYCFEKKFVWKLLPNFRCGYFLPDYLLFIKLSTVCHNDIAEKPFTKFEEELSRVLFIFQVENALKCCFLSRKLLRKLEREREREKETESRIYSVRIITECTGYIEMDFLSRFQSTLVNFASLLVVT